MRKTLPGIIVSLCLLLSIPATFANTSTTLLIQGRSITLEENIEAVITNGLPTTQAYQNGYYVLVQFDEVPTEAERIQLTSIGIKLIDYLPYRTYTAFISLPFLPQATVPLGVRGIHAIPADVKLSAPLATGTIPEHAQAGDALLLNVLLHEGVVLEDALTALDKTGAEIRTTNRESRLVSLKIAQSNLSALTALPVVYYVEPIDPEPQPENLLGTTSHRSNYISNVHRANGSYNGEGVWVAMGDDGVIGPHIDYTGRTDQSNAGASSGNHGDHIAGTIMGAGNLDPTTRGMAWGADLLVYDVWDAVNDSPNSHQSPGVMVTSTSYSNGCNAGYTTFARNADRHIRQNPSLMHIFSAGNSGTSNCNYGAGSGWGNITGGVKIGKNVIAVGNLSATDGLANSSSRGPAHDGRIKPELCAMGSNVYSTNEGNIYAFSSGTSMSCPGVSGTYAQLVHAYRSLNGGVDPEAALIKAAMMNTADDLGNPGPDYRFGFGRINGRRAVNTLEQQTYFTGTMSQNGNASHTISVPNGAAQLRVMVYWTDYEASPNAQFALVNNLDLSVVGPSGNTYFPWILDPTPSPANLNANAVQGIDTLNNMEQITIDAPSSGTYTLQLAGTTVPQGNQTYWIVYEVIEPSITVTYPVSRESMVPGVTETIRWDIFGAQSNTTTIEFSTDGGANWTALSNVNASQSYYTWNVPNVVTGQAMIRVSNGGLSDMSDSTFSIIGVPQNLQVLSACPDSIRVKWSPVNGAQAYEVSVLGQKYMDSTTTTTLTEAYLYNLDANVEQWFSVKALAGDAVGRRALAVRKDPGTWNCLLNEDLVLEQIMDPVGSIYLSCAAGDTIYPKVLVRNTGLNAVSNFTLNYQLSNGTVITETFSQQLAAGDSIQHSFQTPINISTLGIYSLSAWVDASDDNPYNDSTAVGLYSFGGTTVSLPVTEDFEMFNNCATTSNCSQGVCSLTNGWFNLFNGSMDDIDWRTNNGSTPSNGTGPFIDHSPGTNNGKYIYLEASGGCTSQMAEMVSPCIDLSTASSPELRFWYHMFGSDMGELHVDIFYNNNWINDVISPISGNQGNAWREAVINLSPYTGGNVVIKFRGITGDDFRSDMALDNISIQESTLAPQANFSASRTQTCVGIPVQLNDASTNAPNQWNWTITPNTYQFIGNTNANSFQPMVVFTAQADYTVSLSVSNGNGSDVNTKTNYISVSGGSVLPFAEDFESNLFPPLTGWITINPDNSFTWGGVGGVTGIDGNLTRAASVNSFNYSSVGQEDYLETPQIDLGQVNNALLTFDIAYAQYDQNSLDGLRIDISADCGETFQQTAYFRRGAALSTAGVSTSSFVPASAGDWRSDTLDLTQYTGNQIIIRFVALNENGNNLYLDM